MNADRFRLFIESGEVQKLRLALTLNPELANQTVSWYLNQENESDPLHYVSDCVFNGMLDEYLAFEIAEALLEHGAEINGSHKRESPLIAATSLGVESVAALLINSGADLEATSVFGSRALHWAASIGLPQTVKMLIQRGAEIEAKCSEYGATPLFWAVHAVGPYGPKKKRDPIGSAKVLINAGANVNTMNRHGVSALEHAIEIESNELPHKNQLYGFWVCMKVARLGKLR